MMRIGNHLLVRACLVLVTILITGCDRGRGPPQQSDVPRPDIAGAPAAVIAAVRDARQAVLDDPEDAGAWGHYAIVLHAHAWTDEAATAYRAAMQRAPDAYRWPYLLGILLTPQDPVAAEAALATACRLQPDDIPAQRRRADLLERLDRRDAARDIYQALLAKDADNAFARLGLGRVALHDGDITAAIEHLERAARALPDSRRAWSALARAYARADRTADAERAARVAASLDQQDDHAGASDPVYYQVLAAARHAEGALRRSEMFRRAGRLDEALAAARRATELDPDNAYAWAGLGRILVQMGQYAAARDAAERAIDLNPNIAGIRGLLATALFGLDRLDAAAGQVHLALDADPDDADMHRLTALIAARRGRFDEAAASMRAAIARRPFDDAMPLVLSQMLIDGNRAADAVPVLRALLDRRPDHAEAWAQLGRVYRLIDRPADAVIAFERAHRLAPDWWPALAGYAAALVAGRRDADAVAALREALQRAPDHTAAANQLAWLLATSQRDSVHDGHAALRIAERLNADPARQSPNTLETLAAAYAAVERYDDAAQTIASMLDRLADDPSVASHRAEFRRQLERYRNHQPYTPP